MPSIIKPSAQRLHCKDPRLVANYVRLYKDFITKNRLSRRVKKLREGISYPLSSSDKLTYEDIDLTRCKGVAYAEKKCHKLWMGQVAYSPQVRQASRLINAWILLEKKVKGLRTSSRLLSRALKKASLTSEVRALSLQDIKDNLKLAYQDYYKLKGSDKELGATAMDNLAEALAEAGDTKKETMIKVLRHREKQRFTARKIKFLRGKINTGSTTMVTIQSDDGESKDLTGKREIEEAILSNNQQKYQQSFHTPFLQSPLREEFGFKGLTMAAQAVLGGVYEAKENLDQYTKAVIDELAMSPAVRELGPQNMSISLESYRSFWKKANERISCYPAEMSFATMKAGATDDTIAELE